MAKISNFFYRKATFWLAIIFTVLSFSYLFLVMVDFAKGFEIVGETQSLAMSFGLTYEVVMQYFSARTEDMITCYIEFNTVWDNIFALLYGLMYIFWISLLFKPYSAKVKWLNLFPIVQTVFDWLENFQLSKMANNFLENQTVSTFDVQLTSVFVMVKWTASTLIFVLIIIGIVLKIRSTIKKKTSTNS